MISLHQVRKSYRMGTHWIHALKSVSLEIEQGELVAITGRSGSGKSTLLHLLGLLDRPDSGIMQIYNKDISKLSDSDLAAHRSETIGFVFQQFHLLQRMTALENVGLPLVYRKGNQSYNDPAHLLDLVGLGDRMKHRPKEMSGGQQQRVAIARSLVRSPPVLLADEPTGNLDSKSSQEIIALLKELNSRGLTVILVTHEPSIAAECNRFIQIHDGEIVEDRTASPSEMSQKTSVKRFDQTHTHRHLPTQRWLSNLRQATRALMTNKLRTALSALGVIIGVAAVIAMMAVGDSAKMSVEQRVAGLGSNRLTIRAKPKNVLGVVGPVGAETRMSSDQADQILDAIPTVKAVAPMVFGNSRVVFENKNLETRIYGSYPSYQDVYDTKAKVGRYFTMDENRSRARVALLGQTVVKNLFGENNPVGSEIKIQGISFFVIGTLQSKGSSGFRDQDDLILIPLETAMRRVLGRKYLNQIDVSAWHPDLVDETMDRLEMLMKIWPQVPGTSESSYEVRNFASLKDAFQSVSNTFTIMLASVASISLLVGGIGIMNIMLVSVTERTREIGLRKAIGATGKDIQSQFLLEASSLCLLGGSIGVLLGWAIIRGIAYGTGWTMEVSLYAVVLSTSFSALVGIVFGFWPALLASRLDPIEALRHE